MTDQKAVLESTINQRMSSKWSVFPFSGIIQIGVELKKLILYGLFKVSSGFLFWKFVYHLNPETHV